MVLEDLIAANAHALFLCPQQSLAPLLVFHQETLGFLVHMERNCSDIWMTASVMSAQQRRTILWK